MTGRQQPEEPEPVHDESIDDRQQLIDLGQMEYDNHNLMNDFNNNHQLDTPPTPVFEFEHLPFFNTMKILLTPIRYFTYANNVARFTSFFCLHGEDRNSILNSWNFDTQEYKIKIILRFVQVGLEENVTERLPYNMTVCVNDRQCKLPPLNEPSNVSIRQWQCNVPIDITQQTDLIFWSLNKLQITWSKEPHQYMIGVFVANKLTQSELLEQLKKRPVRPSDKTRDLIKKSMESDGDFGVDSLFASLKDPLSKMIMELPARGINCIHLQCFDVIQFLKMNEPKQKWICPLCMNKVKFENIEVDEFFLNILKSPNLSKECEGVFLLEDGSWTERQTKRCSKMSTSNGKQSANNVEIITVSDSDDEDGIPIVKRAKQDLPKFEEPIIKSGNIVNAEDQITTSDSYSIENDLVLDLSFKNNSSTSSEY